MVDVAGVERYVAAGQFRGDVRPVEHARGTCSDAAAAAASATARCRRRVPRMSSSTVRPRLRAAEQTSELVVHVTGSKQAVSAASRAMSFRRKVPQNSIDRRNLEEPDTRDDSIRYDSIRNEVKCSQYGTS